MTSQSRSRNSVDPIWTSSATARQIHALGAVEKDISRLLALASSSISLLTLPQTDTPKETLPQGDERSEQFVLEVTQYFETLDSIHLALRTCLAQLRRARIAPSSIDALPPGFVPPTFGVGLPEGVGGVGSHNNKGLQEVQVERDAWKGVLDALQRLKDARLAASVNNTSLQEQDVMLT
ncbi:hypothetical protein JB92DRAFT_2808514 [Gautieria morchelliformis]|nr:hypothetical protein JB92DRAFT_2808514 [Gautieria morchelliformis]